MRDIRQDLVERLEILDATTKRLQTEIEEKQGLRDQLKRLLEQEGRGWAKAYARRPAGSNDSRQPSSSVLGTAREIPLGEGAPGRIINFSLVGMQRHGIIKKLSNGKWASEERKG